ncbi:MAG TPA: hypothetical protein VK138_02755 [Acidiferrobacterales bacterium]|nr:hypothetical protein [Acidiferrobacterales bacterium]
MTTYPTTSLWSEVRGANELSQKALGYFQARLKNRLHQLVIGEFIKQEKSGTTKADIARRIGKRPEQITRLLGAPGNWTLDTVSDLLLAMGSELAAQAIRFDDVESRAVTSIEWQIEPTKRKPGPKLRVISQGTTADRPVAATGS